MKANQSIFSPDANIDQQSSGSSESSEDEEDNDEIDVNGVQAMDEAAAATATELLVQTVNNLPLVPLLWTLLFQTIHKHSPPFPKLYRQFFMSTVTKK